MVPARSELVAVLVGVLVAGCARDNEHHPALRPDTDDLGPPTDAGTSADDSRPTVGDAAAIAPPRPPTPRYTALRPDVGLGLDCEDDAGDHPALLGCTGLYVDWKAKVHGLDIHAYDPALHLWSDGAEKSRFIWLPPGRTIDTSNMDEWVFPIGTKLWKEFRVHGRRVETRYLQKREDGTWLRTTYAWSYDQTEALETTLGQVDVWGTGYEIPAQTDCVICHKGRMDGVLGFEAVGLSHPMATGLTVEALTRAGLLSDPPAEPIVIPGNAKETAALGWLHANCGNACHNGSANAEAGFTGLRLRLDTGSMATVEDTGAWTTAVGVASRFQPTMGPTLLRITPGDAQASAIPYRDGRRDDASTKGIQMPPLLSHQVDVVGVELVKNWINAM